MNSKKNSFNFYDIGCRAKNLFLYDVAIKYLEQAVALDNVEAMIELGDFFMIQEYIISLMMIYVSPKK